MAARALAHILRPYAVQPLPVNAAVYSRLYSLVQPPCIRAYATTKNPNPREPRDQKKLRLRKKGKPRKPASDNSEKLSGYKNPKPKQPASNNSGELSEPTNPEPKQPASNNSGELSEPTNPEPNQPASNNSEKPSEPVSTATKVAQRIQKLFELDALKWPRIEHPEGVKYMNNAEFKRRCGDKDFKPLPGQDIQIRGRIIRVRKQGGKLLFLDIMSNFHTVQIVLDFGHIQSVSDVTLEQFQKQRDAFLRGDFVSAEGSPVRTPAGDLALKANKLPYQLSPSIAPVPRRLINEETKVQSPHLNLLLVHEASATIRFRSELIWWLRVFFQNKRFIEVQTPIIADYAGGAAARPFLTSSTEFPRKELALRIAPELWLKRMIVGGFDRVFEIGPSFRNEGLDSTHNPEFTTCEFYQAYANLSSLISFTTNLIQQLALFSAAKWEKWGSKERYEFEPDYFVNFKQVEFIPALEEALDIKFPDLSETDALSRLRETLHAKLGHQPAPGASLNKLLDTLAGKYLEPESDHAPLYIINHPACMTPLSKSFTCPKTGQLVSARAELFIKGREIANMYEEENDPFEQRRKFELQLQARNAEGASPEDGQAVVDESYIEALEHGLPPTGGWGCGIDRLVMMFSASSRISDTLPFGSLRNVVNVTQGSRRS
ncbi:hypothetical protein JX266_008981 [Neoarthrinium moseri]|nr:hypothetical protein JX266_008981 [Neoarthrinium moseri]